MTNLEIAIKAAKKLGTYLRKNFEYQGNVEKKDYYDDVVSKVDMKSDQIIVQILKKETPDYNILSEESGFIDKKSNFTWVIDSLDGSANYLNNIPYFGCSIGLAKTGFPVLGVIIDPMNKSIIYAEKGKGAFYNGRKVRIRNAKIEESILGFDYGRTLKDEMNTTIGNFVKICRYVRIAGSSVLGFRDTAICRTQAYIHNNLKPWDACAGTIIIKEAGGIATNFKKDDWSINDRDVIATSTDIYEEILKHLVIK